MLNSTGTSYTIEIPLGSYQACRKQVEEIKLLKINYLAAVDDAARIVILKQISDIQSDMLESFLVERL